MLLPDRVAFVLVATGALDGHGAKGVEDVGDHVVPVQVAGHLAVDFRLGYFGMSYVIPRSRGEEPEPEDTIGPTGKESVARNLFLHELGIRLVLVEGSYDVITIGPGIGPQLVLVVPAGIGVLGHVQPMTGETFPIAGRSKQTIDQSLVSRFWVFGIVR